MSIITVQHVFRVTGRYKTYIYIYIYIGLFYVLLTVHTAMILVNNQLDARFFFMYVYFYSLHVLDSYVSIVAGHVARMGEGRGVYRVLVGKPKGKRPMGRPRRRWEDNIRMDL